MTRVLLLTTGGTIASRRGDQGLEPQISARGLLEYMSDLLRPLPHRRPGHPQPGQLQHPG